MRHRALRKKIFKLREAARRRTLSPSEKAILNFATDYVRLQEYSVGASSKAHGFDGSEAEDEDEGNNLVCSNPRCGEDDHPDDAEFCSKCGSRLKSISDEAVRRSDEDERRRGRADETEGRKGAEPDRNDLGYTGYKGQNTPKHSERVGADEAVKTFRTQYARTRESSGVVRSPITGA